MSTIGTIELIATIDTSQYKKGAAEIDKANKDIEGSTVNTERKSNASFGGIAKVGLAAVAASAIAVGAAITSNIGSAIKRVDTLNNSSRTFANLGFDAQTVDSSMKALNKSIQGLPTPLDAAVRGVQLIASSTNDLGKSQKIFSAINNAVIGFGGSAEEVTGVTQQLSQAFAGGRIDAQTWNSLLQNNLGPTLNAIARSMGITTQQLKDGLSDGSISVSQFQDQLIKLNEQGGGGIKSLEQISKDATAGIGTGWSNLNTAIQRGLAAVIEGIGSQNISNAISSIGKAFETALKGIIPAIKFLADNKGVFGTIAAGIMGVVAAVTAWWTITKLITISQAIFNAVLTANPIGLIIVGIAGLIAALTFFFTKTETGKQLFQDFMNIVKGVFNWVSNNWPLLLTILLGPFGFFIVQVIKNFDTIKEVVSTVFNAIKDIILGAINWIRDNWQLVLSIITGPIGLAVSMIVRHFDTIKNAVLAVYNWIRGAFSTIAEIGTSILKGAVNSVLGFAENTINGFITLINNALNAINKIPGVNIGKIGQLKIPRLAEGGIITSPTLAMVGEGGESEAVIPLSKLDNIMNESGRNSSNLQVTLNLSGIMTRSKSDERDIAKNLIRRVNEELTAKGLKPIGEGAI